MSQTIITVRLLNSLKPKEKPYFIRDHNLKGFGVKVNPSGAISFIAEIRHQGKTKRKAIGSHPVITLKAAKAEALSFIHSVRTGIIAEQLKQSITLGELFKRYTAGDRLKPRTIRDYQEATGFYLSDWMERSVAAITKDMVEQRFYLIRDKGISGGKPTYSQATKVMRILSALMNFAMADDLVDINPVVVLKQKRINRSTVKKTDFLSVQEASEVLEILTMHPVELAVSLMFYTGLRKNEALSLKWKNISEGIIRIPDTKNHREHIIPVTDRIQSILESVTRGGSPYLFPSPVNKKTFIQDVRSTLGRIKIKTGITFRCHDLRRTFATRAAEVGIDFLMIKRLLNHKSNDITSQYIQWDSPQNLGLMKKALEQITY